MPANSAFGGTGLCIPGLASAVWRFPASSTPLRATRTYTARCAVDREAETGVARPALHLAGVLRWHPETLVDAAHHRLARLDRQRLTVAKFELFPVAQRSDGVNVGTPEIDRPLSKPQDAAPPAPAATRLPEHRRETNVDRARLDLVARLKRMRCVRSVDLKVWEERPYVSIGEVHRRKRREFALAFALRPAYETTRAARVGGSRSQSASGGAPFGVSPRVGLDSGGGIRTRDLRVMSPTSYQTAPPRVAKSSFSREVDFRPPSEAPVCGGFPPLRAAL